MKISSNASLSPFFRLISVTFHGLTIFFNLSCDKDEKISDSLEIKVNSEIGQNTMQKLWKQQEKKIDFLLEDF